MTMVCISLQYLQIIGLISNDDFLLQFNVNISTLPFNRKLRDFKNFLNYDMDELSDHIDAKWLTKQEPFFQQILSRTGFCYTFNFPGANEVFNLDKMASNFSKENIFYDDYYDDYYDDFKAPSSYPLKTNNYRNGLNCYIYEKKTSKIFLYTFYTDIIEKYHRSEIYDGFRVVIHDPFEIISGDSDHFYTLTNQSLTFYINPVIMDYDETIVDFTPEERNCYLEDEKILSFFKVYTRNNCKQECLANLTLESCSCVQFFMVRPDSIRICGINDSICFKNVEEQFELDSRSCECYPSCRRIDYHGEIAVNDFAVSEGVSRGNHLLPSIFDVLFSTEIIYPSIRKKQFTIFDGVSYVGGLLGKRKH